MTISEILSTVEDTRSFQGRRHQLPDVLLMCTMAVMSDYSGYRSTGRFLRNSERNFRSAFGVYNGLPCYVTVRDILQGMDFDKFSDAFNRWACQYVPMCKEDTKAADGKAIGGTAAHASDACQNFVSPVSVFSSQRGIVLHCRKTENGKESEIPQVQELICALDVEGEIFTLDALHCQKNGRNHCIRGKSLHDSG